MANIALLEPYYTGSHKKWARGLQKHSSHTIQIFEMAGRFWKWRMHGAALTLAEKLRASSFVPDLIVATDMLDVATFRAMLGATYQDVPLVVYFHENQLTYPTRPGQKRDMHYAWLNYTSMMTADYVFFNSAFHRTAWFEELPRMLKHFPDYSLLHTIEALETKAGVLWLGLNLARFEKHRPLPHKEGPLRILWNHRWEYDKQPQVFFNALYKLKQQGLDFEVLIHGESFRNEPEEFEKAKKQLGDNITHFGYTKLFGEYAASCWYADVVVSTAIQDFFGGSICEAMACGCMPLLPNRLNYPVFVDDDHRDICLYETKDALVDHLVWAAEHLDFVRGLSLHEQVLRFDWQAIISDYDATFDSIVNGRNPITLQAPH